MASEPYGDSCDAGTNLANQISISLLMVERCEDLGAVYFLVRQGISSLLDRALN